MEKINEIIKMAEQNGYVFKYNNNHGTYEFHNYKDGEVIEVYDRPGDLEGTLNEMIQLFSFLY